MDDFRIEYLEMTQIGPFEHIEINFPPKTDPNKAEIHILTGENGTGKTTMLKALIPTNLGTNISNKFWSPQNSKFVISHSDLKLLSNQLNKRREFEDNPSISPKLKKFLKNRFSYTNFDIFYSAYSGYRRSSNFGIQAIRELQENPMVSAADFQNSINPQNLIQWIANVKTRELIALGKGDKAKATVYRNTIRLMEDAIAQVIEAKVEFDLEENPLCVLMKIDGQPLNFDQLPDGLKSMVSWIGDLLMRMDRIKWVDDLPIPERRFFLFLDEIEVHLHPAWQRKILPVVQKLFKNAQIFISTHSPFVVGSVDGAWVHRFVKKKGFSVLAGSPVLSEDSQSYDYILEEIFGITQRFGVEVECKLAEFKVIKAQILTHQPYDQKSFDALIRELTNQSAELESIIGMELKQLKRISNQDFTIAA